VTYTLGNTPLTNMSLAFNTGFTCRFNF